MELEREASLSTKREDKINLYSIACIQYEVDSDYTKIVEICLILAALYEKTNSCTTAMYYTKAATVLYNAGGDGLKLLEKAIYLFLEGGHYVNVAKAYVKIAENNREGDCQIDAYKNAVKYYRLAESIGPASLYELKLAYLYIDNNDWKKAIDLLDRVIRYYLPLDLTTNICNTLILHVILCHMMNNYTIIGVPVDYYCNMYQLFDTTGEYKFIINIQSAYYTHYRVRFSILCD